MSLPVLDPRFFTAHKPSANFFQKWKSQNAWNEAILPIYEWDGFVFIALDQSKYGNQDPVTLHSQFPFPHVFVFAQTSELQNVWMTYSNSKQESAASSAVLDMDDLAAQAGNTPARIEPELLNENISSETLTSEDASNEANKTNQAQDEAPEGFQFNQNSPAQKSSAPQNDDPFGDLSTVIAKQPAEESLDLTQISNPSIPNLNLNKSVETKTIPVNPSEWVDSFFDKLNSHFPYSLIFLVNDNQAMPWKWSSTLKSDNPSSIDLNTPSPFSVVNRTQQSYHGPVAESPEIRKLCQEWQLKSYPQHMTAAPIKVEDRLIGILVSIGEAEHYQNTLLQLCESCAKEIAEIIQKQPQILKAS